MGNKDLLLSDLTPEEIRAYVGDLLKFVESIAPARRRFRARWSLGKEEEECVIALLQHRSGAGQRIVHLHMASDQARQRIGRATAEKIFQAANTMLREVNNPDAENVYSKLSASLCWFHLCSDKL